MMIYYTITLDSLCITAVSTAVHSILQNWGGGGGGAADYLVSTDRIKLNFSLLLLQLNDFNSNFLQISTIAPFKSRYSTLSFLW